MGIAYPPAPMDKLTARLTVVTLAIVVGFIAAVALLARPLRIPLALSIVLVATWATAVIGCWLVKPLAYEVSEDSVRVHRRWPFGTVSIPLSGLHQVRETSPAELSFWRTLKISGGEVCFGCFGTFWSKGLGFFWMSCTSRTSGVLLRNRRKSVLSPASPGEFVDEVKRRTGIA